MEALIRLIVLLIFLIPNNYILAEPISGHSVVLQVLEKISAQISTMEIAIGEKKRYGSLLAKEVDCTYSHAVKILQTLEELKLVDFEKKGRIKLIKLTKKGEEVAEDIDSIRRRLM